MHGDQKKHVKHGDKEKTCDRKCRMSFKGLS